MATQVTMPVLGLTMEEGTVAEWLKREGDTVQKDEPLFIVEMDKGTQEVPSPAAGVLHRIIVPPGTPVPIRTPLAEILEPGELSPPLAEPPATAGQRLFASPRARMRARALSVDLRAIRGSGPHGRVVEADVLGAVAAADAHLAAAAVADDQRIVVTPLARRLAREHGVDIASVEGTGPGGRITQDDIVRAAAPPVSPAVPPVSPAAPPVSPAAPPVSPAAPPVSPAVGTAGPARQPLSRLRRLTAERMAASAQATARVTLFLDADFSEATRFRNQLQPELARLGVPKLPWDALIARAAALALVDHPALLAQWVDGEGLRPTRGVHVGVAVALDPEGLVVPVLRNADARSLRDLAADLLQLADKARAGRLTPAEMQAGTFTITNLGAYRIDGFTPLINPPETAILGVGRIADKPVVIDGRIEPRTMCTLSLSFDHRVVDGAPAAAFLLRLAELLERPYALLGI